MANLPAATDQNFKDEVLGAPAAIVDFWGEGWGACVRLAPVVEEVAQEYAGKVKVMAVDAHNNYETASEYGIMGLPTLVFFKAGQEVGRVVGAVPKDRIVSEIQSKIEG